MSKETKNNPVPGPSTSNPDSAPAPAPQTPNYDSSNSELSEVLLWSPNHSWSSENTDDEEQKLTETANSLLSFNSPRFSPTLALKTNELVPASDGARKYLNLQQYSSAVKSPSKSPVKTVRIAKVLANEPKESDHPASSTTFPIPGRRFLPHQMPVYRPRKEHPDTLKLMNSFTGPLSCLNRVMTENIRVKIWTRNDKGFRGFLTGFVDAFDKHWNIALRDCDEQFVRRRVIKYPVLPHSETKACNETETNQRLFIRLQAHLRQNYGHKHFVNTTPSGSNSEGKKSSRIYVGDMDPLALCRTTLSTLSLRDDKPTIHQEKPKDSSNSLCPDVVECHRVAARASSSSLVSAPPARSLPVPTTTTPTRQQNSSSKAKKKTLTVFKTPYEDNFGFMVVAHTKKYELVERHVGQLLLMGNDIVFIETTSSG